jgi:hypothetical protein
VRVVETVEWSRFASPIIGDDDDERLGLIGQRHRLLWHERLAFAMTRIASMVRSYQVERGLRRCTAGGVERPASAACAIRRPYESCTLRHDEASSVGNEAAELGPGLTMIVECPARQESLWASSRAVWWRAGEFLFVPHP